jgi:hypothetical protein
MSKVTPSALRGLSVAAGTVGLAAVGAAAAAVPASAAGPAAAGLGGGGLPLSTNALSAAKGLMAHNGGQIAGVPVSGLPVLNQFPELVDFAPAAQATPGASEADLGAPRAETRSRTADSDHQSAARAATAAVMPSVPAAPGGTPAPVAVPAPQTVPPTVAQKSPLAGVTDSLPVKSLPVVGGVAGGLPVLGGGGLDGLPVGGLTHLA